MRVRILGAHQGESRDTRFISILVDGRLAIDAGGLTSSLTLEEQRQIEAVLITHRHYDHIKDLPALAHTTWEQKALEVYCSDDTRAALQAHMFNNVIWPAMREKQGRYFPTLFHEVRDGVQFSVGGYSVLPVKMPHTVPTLGYSVASGNKRMFYSADTHGEGNPAWADLKLDLLVIETTMSSRYEADASRFKHMTPLSLRGELAVFYEKQGYYPRTLCVHLNPTFESEIKEELAKLSEELGADITAANEGLEVEI